jgi:ketosteroid isomerase-like protein
MSENVELVRSIYESFNRRDWDAAFRAADPDFEFSIERGPNAGVHRGREVVKGVLEDQASAFDLWVVEPEEFFERDDLVVAFVRFRLRPKGSNAEFEIRIGNLWTIRDGNAVSVRGFPQREEALKAAGLQEDP